MNLSSLQDTIKNRLQANAYFTGLDIFTEKIGDIQNSIDQALSKLGLALLILTPEARREDAEPHRQVSRLKISVIVSVVEDPTLNSTGKTALAVAEKIITVLHASTDVSGHSEKLYLDDDALMLKLDPRNPNLLIYAVRFFMEITIK